MSRRLAGLQVGSNRCTSAEMEREMTAALAQLYTNHDWSSLQQFPLLSRRLRAPRLGLASRLRVGDVAGASKPLQ